MGLVWCHLHADLLLFPNTLLFIQSKSCITCHFTPAVSRLLHFKPATLLHTALPWPQPDWYQYNITCTESHESHVSPALLLLLATLWTPAWPLEAAGGGCGCSCHSHSPSCHRQQIRSPCLQQGRHFIRRFFPRPPAHLATECPGLRWDDKPMQVISCPWPSLRVEQISGAYICCSKTFDRSS